jgi:pimeloyl-ACP methyl ester carboxylesterase
MKLAWILVPLAAALALSCLAGAGIAGTTRTLADPGLNRFYQQTLVWRACGEGFQCTKAKVPLDYAKPSGPTIKLALKRVKGRSGSGRVGSLFINPGGPGASGIDELTQFGATLSKPLGTRYDIVGFDPRGVGASRPVECLTDAQTDAWFARPIPTTPAKQATYLRWITTFGKGCLAKSGPLAAHMSTVEVVKDLDILRAAVGDRKLNYLGSSYGTRIGSVYAQLFTKLVGRMVLDGAEHPTLTGVDAERSQLRGYQVALRSYVQSCVTAPDCPLGASESEALRTLQTFIDGLASKPLPTGDPQRPLTDSRAVLAIVPALSQPTVRGLLTSGLAGALQDADGSGLASLGDLFLGRQANGTYAANGNEFEANQAVKCLDSASRGGATAAQKVVAGFKAISPVFGPLWAWNASTCELWPIKATSPLPKIRPLGAPPILVVGTTRDNATPYTQAVALTKALKTATLLTYDGDGHLAYLRNVPCIDRWVNRYVLTGKTPAKGTRCSS